MPQPAQVIDTLPQMGKRVTRPSNVEELEAHLLGVQPEHYVEIDGRPRWALPPGVDPSRYTFDGLTHAYVDRKGWWSSGGFVEHERAPTSSEKVRRIRLPEELRTASTVARERASADIRSRRSGPPMAERPGSSPTDPMVSTAVPGTPFGLECANEWKTKAVGATSASKNAVMDWRQLRGIRLFLRIRFGANRVRTPWELPETQSNVRAVEDLLPAMKAALDQLNANRGPMHGHLIEIRDALLNAVAVAEQLPEAEDGELLRWILDEDHQESFMGSPTLPPQLNELLVTSLRRSKATGPAASTFWLGELARVEGLRPEQLALLLALEKNNIDMGESVADAYLSEPKASLEACKKLKSAAVKKAKDGAIGD